MQDTVFPENASSISPGPDSPSFDSPSPGALSREAAFVADVLRWHLLAGADEAIDDIAHDRFAEARVPAKRKTPSNVRSADTGQGDSVRAQGTPLRSGGAGPSSISGGDASVKSAVALAAAAETLDALRVAVSGFEGCPLKRTATTTVFGDGAPDAKVVLIGEAPGAEEDRQGVPFVGAAGRLLDRMLASIGLDRGSVFISNTVFWRPPGNRTPTSQEIAVCQPFVERLIELISPQVLITLGGPASQSVLAQKGGITRLRGRWMSFSTPRLGHPVAAMAMFHPAYLLRLPEQKRLAWRDLLAVGERLESGDVSPP